MTDPLPDVLANRLGYLFKQAHARLLDLAGPEMAPFGIDGRQLAVLAVLGAGAPLSQQAAAEVLGVDRTTMVGLIDELERKELVERQRSPADRRKNLVRLTDHGRRCLKGAGEARDAAERRFLEPLGESGAARFVEALQILASRPPA